MNAMGKFERSWRLFRSSVQVITRNPRLLAFPIVISGFMAIIFLFFLAPAVLRPTGYSYFQGEHWEAIARSLFRGSVHDANGGQVQFDGFTTVGLAYLAFLYFVSMFFATFFNVAFYNEILAALGGQTVSISRGLRFACTRLKAIVLWTLFAGLVGLLIRTIEEKLAFAGRIVARLVGLAWSIASVFVIPVLVREEQSVNPLKALQKSATMLKRTWGEALIGYVGLSFGNVLVALGSVGLLGGAVALSIVLDNFWILAVVGGGWLLAIIALAYVTSVASQVYKGALYLYAAEGFIAAPYDRELFDQAWKFKKATD